MTDRADDGGDELILRHIERDGARLAGLWRDGDGVPLVFVPGIMADAATFVPVLEALDTAAPVLSLDRRGRGDSAPLDASYSVAQEVDDLLAWIAELGSVQLAGWSYGATIALETAARVGGDGRVVGPVLAYDPLLAPLGQDVLPALRIADPDTAVEIINIDFSHVPREQVEAMRATAQWAVLRELARPLAAELTAANEFTADAAAWAGLEALVVAGEFSRQAEPYGPALQRALSLLPRARTTVLPGHGHFAHLEAPTELATALRAELIA